MKKQNDHFKNHLCYFIFQEENMLKNLLWLPLIKYRKIDTKGGNGRKRNPMRLLYTLHADKIYGSLVKDSIIG